MTGRRSGAIPETAPDQTPESQQELDESRAMNAPEPDQNDSTPSRAAADQGREQGNKGGDQGRGCCEPSTPTSSNAPPEPATVDDLIDSSAASPTEPDVYGDALRRIGWADPEPPASDEPARCEHGRTVAHQMPNTYALVICPGPAASGTPDGGL